MEAADFDRWALYYDLVHTGLPGEAAFYVKEALNGEGAVLEVGCGTGRIAIAMALAGSEVTGLDFSPAMLQLCRAKLEQAQPVQGRLDTVQADMRAFDLGRRFQLVAMPYRTFMHLLTPRDQERCLACIRGHMAEDARLVFNVWAAPSAAVARMTRSRAFQPVDRYVLEAEELVVEHACAVDVDWNRQRMIEQHYLRELGVDGAVVHETLLPLDRRWSRREELEALLPQAGLRVESVLGDFQGAAFGPESSELIVVARAV